MAKINSKIKNQKNYCTIYIVRHGETEWNVKRIIQGHKDSSLTQKGIQQAQTLSKRLKKIKFDAIFSSDLGRAQRTAEIIALEHKLAFVTNKALREKTWGKYEGKRVVQYRKELKELLDKYENLSDDKKFTFKLPHGIETNEAAVTRFIRFLREIAVAHIGKTVLIVTHGGVMQFLLIRLGFATFQELRWGSIDNNGYIKLLSDGVDFFIKETYGVNKKKV